MEWKMKNLHELRTMNGAGKALRPWEVLNICHMYYTRPNIVFKEMTFLDVMKSQVKYSIDFEACYCVTFHQVREKEIAEEMKKV